MIAMAHKVMRVTSRVAAARTLVRLKIMVAISVGTKGARRQVVEAFRSHEVDIRLAAGDPEYGPDKERAGELVD